MTGFLPPAPHNIRFERAIEHACRLGEGQAQPDSLLDYQDQVLPALDVATRIRDKVPSLRMLFLIVLPLYRVERWQR